MKELDVSIGAVSSFLSTLPQHAALAWSSEFEASEMRWSAESLHAQCK
ncbi:MAG: hypothetical protein Q7T63_12650 [Burkholderiaceae bacterium]|nr:hypothetical protein [Burkholderiaceae bacterium]